MKSLGMWAGLAITVAAVGCGQGGENEDFISLQQEIAGSGGSHNVDFCSSPVAGSPPNVTSVTVGVSNDASIEEALQTTNLGSLGYCMMKGGTNKRHCLLSFDLSSIPSTNTVVNGCIRVAIGDASGANYPGYQLLRNWSQTQVTWQRAKTGITWQVPGAWGPLDSGATTVATIPKNSLGWQSFVLSKDLIQAWVANPATNFGIVFGNDNSTDGLSISTQEDATNAPQLTVWSTP